MCFQLARLAKELEDEKEDALALAAEEADDRVADASGQLKSAERAIEKLEKRLSSQLELVAELDEDKLALEENLLAADSQRDSAQRRAESVLAKLEAKDSDLLTAAQEADDAVAELAMSLENTEVRADKMERQLNERETEVDELRRELSDRQGEWQGNASAAEEKASRLMNMMEVKDAEAVRAAAEADSATESLSTQLDEARADLGRLRQLAEDKSSALGAMTGEKEKLRMELSKCEARLNEVGTRLQGCEQKLEDTNIQWQNEGERANRNAHEISMLGKQLEQSHKDLSGSREQQAKAQSGLTETRLRIEQLEMDARTRAANHSADQETLRQLHHVSTRIPHHSLRSRDVFDRNACVGRRRRQCKRRWQKRRCSVRVQSRLRMGSVSHAWRCVPRASRRCRVLRQTAGGWRRWNMSWGVSVSS